MFYNISKSRIQGCGTLDMCEVLWRTDHIIQKYEGEKDAFPLHRSCLHASPRRQLPCLSEKESRNDPKWFQNPFSTDPIGFAYGYYESQNGGR